MTLTKFFDNTDSIPPIIAIAMWILLFPIRVVACLILPPCVRGEVSKLHEFFAFDAR